MLKSPIDLAQTQNLFKVKSSCIIITWQLSNYITVFFFYFFIKPNTSLGLFHASYESHLHISKNSCPVVLARRGPRPSLGPFFGKVVSRTLF